MKRRWRGGFVLTETDIREYNTTLLKIKRITLHYYVTPWLISRDLRLSVLHGGYLPIVYLWKLLKWIGILNCGILSRLTSLNIVSLMVSSHVCLSSMILFATVIHRAPSNLQANEATIIAYLSRMDRRALDWNDILSQGSSIIKGKCSTRAFRFKGEGCSREGD